MEFPLWLGGGLGLLDGCVGGWGALGTDKHRRANATTRAFLNQEWTRAQGHSQGRLRRKEMVSLGRGAPPAPLPRPSCPWRFGRVFHGPDAAAAAALVAAVDTAYRRRRRGDSLPVVRRQARREESRRDAEVVAPGMQMLCGGGRPAVKEETVAGLPRRVVVGGTALRLDFP